MFRTDGSSALAMQETFPLDYSPTIPSGAQSYSNDDASKMFANPSEMLTFLQEREDNATWQTGVGIQSLCVSLLEDATYVYRLAPPEIIFDTAKNTGLVLHGDYLPQTAIRSCAIPSLQDRARISGSALGKVSKPVLRNILNECLHVAAKNSVARIRIADGKISAVRSSRYVPLAMPELFETTMAYIADKFSTASPLNHFAGGSWSHIITTAEWALSGEDALIEAYKTALSKHGIEHSNIQPGLRLSSSDIGESSVNLTPKLVVGKDRLLLPLGGAIGLEHKDDATMSKFRENLDGIFALYGDKLAKLARLLDVEISYPESCMKGVLKRLGVPKKYGVPTLETFARGFADGDSCTAHDIYYGLGDLLFQLQIHNVTGEQVLRMEETIAKTLSWNFSDYDHPVALDY